VLRFRLSPPRWPAALCLAGFALALPLIWLGTIAQSGPGGLRTGAALDRTVASRSRQLSQLEKQIGRHNCRGPAARNEGCRELRGRHAALEREIAHLKRRAGPHWTEPQLVQAEPQPRFLENLFGGLFGGRPPRRQRPLTLGPPGGGPIDLGQGDDMAKRRYFTYRASTRPEGSYRTLCVRMCDGFYWPIAFSTRPSTFEQQDAYCRASCGEPAQLFYYANPGQELEQMRSLYGERYADLPNAFRYRTEYVADCRCKPDPWTQEAKAEYKRRAIAAREGRSSEDDIAALSPPPVIPGIGGQTERYEARRGTAREQRRRTQYQGFFPFSW
jgi:hypothetical protein